MARLIGAGMAASTITTHENATRGLILDRYLRYCQVLELSPRTVFKHAFDEARGKRNSDIVAVDLRRLSRSGNPLAPWAKARLKKLPGGMLGLLLVSRTMQDQLAELCECSRGELLRHLRMPGGPGSIPGTAA